MIKDATSKELFDYIRSADVKDIPSLKSILSSYQVEKISIVELLLLLKQNKEKILLIDARSEKEYEESAVPYSINFPVLNNFERHNVGLIYKKYSQSAALWLALQYANPKLESLKTFLENNNAKEKNIFIYCWRGGGRSSYLAKMICDLGYKPSILIGGHKSFRKIVNEFFSQEIFPHELFELSGLTGCGKSELLKSVSNELPAIDLESSARHYSSLLGHIPFEIRNFSPIANQSAFENGIYSQIFFTSSDFSEHSLHSKSRNFLQGLNMFNPYLIESESKKVGDFEIPKIIYDKLLTAPTIKIISTLENRVRRIVKDYFGDDMRGLEPMKSIMKEKEKFFKQQLSNKIYSELISLLDSQKVYEFTEIMIVEYYDKKYKDKGKKPIAEISTENIGSAKKELIEIYKKFSKK
jgi:tRNA 2-selenouridine synthase